MTYLYPAGARQGTTVEVSVGGNFGKWPVDVWVSGKDVTARAGKEKGKLSFTVSADAILGTYWVRIHDATGASSLRPFIVGSLPETAEKEPNDEATTAQPVELPVVVNGVLSKAGDVDNFTVKLRKGQTLIAAVEANGTLRSPIDAVLQIASSDGFVLEQGNDHAGLDPLVTFTAPKDGSYFVRVFAFPSTPDSSIRFTGSESSVYRLTLTTDGYAEYTWPLAVARDKPGSVALVGWNIPDAAKAIPVSVSRGNDSVLVTHPRVANTVRVAVELHPCLFRMDLAKAINGLTPPFTFSGRFEKEGQSDQFRVVAKKGQSLTVRCESPSLGLTASPVITVLTADGKPLTKGEPGQPNTDATLTVTPPADGIYTIEVRDLYGSHGLRHAYRLSVRPPQPDYSLTVASDQITCTPEKPAEIAVTIIRRDGFKSEVTLTAEGLPEGVSAKVIPSAGKAEPNKLTFRLIAEKTYHQGAFRIVGVSSGLKRIASAALPDFATLTEELWLSPGEVAAIPKKKR